LLQNKAEALVRSAAAAGANIILLQELFETPYFCQEQKQDYYRLAKVGAVVSGSCWVGGFGK
jgi:predicted amidohydrolase